jgi:hypothetical protein
MRPARTETYEHTISGLLAKRVDLFHEAERIRDRLAVIKNDVAALDRVLHTLGYAGDLNADMPRQKHERLFGQGELAAAANVGLSTLRDFETGRRVPIANNLGAIEAALTAKGIEFWREDNGASGIKHRPSNPRD